ncbi:hypothetical protein SASPL_151174 [Salvia splendens]|uniref:Uncharacterized protein n=1 Tax=Salvia splendens TaxID=180675 RepID=A0A8X8W8V9_SALSN|nr:hypothetical protein SASPL_151174 [Salvia splendens]
MQTPKASSLRSILQCLCVLLCFSIKSVSSIDTLKQGDNLTSSSQLDSPNGLFTLRFYTPESNQSTGNLYIAIVFNRGDSAHKAVWIANRDDPLSNESSPELTLGTRGDLTITRDGGDPIQVYTARESQTTTSNITATLTDTGNFILLSNGTQVLWQSYDHPTDTLLSGMKLSANTKITSWLTPSNPAPGPFTLEWDPSQGELVIRRRGMAYWRSGRLVDYHDDDLGNVKNFEHFYISPDPDNFNYNLTSQGDYFMYTVIQVEGRTVDSRKVTSGWLLDEAGNITTIDDRGITLVMASVCYGYNSGDDLYDKGCELWEQPKCLKRRQLVDLRSGYFTHANTTPVERTSDSNASLSLSDCRDACWKWSDCECAGYANYIGRDSGCSYWIGRDLEWVQNSAGSDEKIYVLQSPPKAKAKSYIGIILGVVSAVVLLMLAVVVLIMRNRKVKREEELHELLTMEGYTGSYELDNNGHQLKLFTYSSVISATDNFSSNNKLGEGGFGPVYKGRTGEGQDIAVKLLSRKSGQGLLSPSGREQLDWEKRFNIIEGTAQGLLYLHKHSRLKIIHRDMKPNNILLDQNMTPKISDFGLARIFKEAASEVNTNRRVGTYGYMAPEYAMQGIFSVKSDVYSYGVLVLEIVSGRRNGSFHEIEGPLSIVEYAWELWRKDSALELMDSDVEEEHVCLEQRRNAFHIGTSVLIFIYIGADAMFADLGHFNKRGIQLGFSFVVYPSLIVTCTGQTAYLLKHPENIVDAYYSSIPSQVYSPMFVISTLAAVVASQSMIYACFSILKQSLALDCFPRVSIIHTSSKHHGQVYCPEINYILLFLTVGLVVGFKGGVELANAYGVVVIWVMIITTFLTSLVMLVIWKMNVVVVLGFFVPYTEQEDDVRGREQDECDEARRCFVRKQRLLPDSRSLLFLYGSHVGIPPIIRHYIQQTNSVREIMVLVTIRTMPIKTTTPIERLYVRKLRHQGVHRPVAVCTGSSLLLAAITVCTEPSAAVRRCSSICRRPADLSLHLRALSLVDKLNSFSQIFRRSDLPPSVFTVGAEVTSRRVHAAAAAGCRRCGVSAARLSDLVAKLIELIDDPNEAQKIQCAVRRGIVLVTGRTILKVNKKSGMLARFTIDYLYRFLQKNSRPAFPMLQTPSPATMQVGMLYEI